MRASWLSYEKAVPFIRAAGISSQQVIPSSLGGVPGAGRIPSKRSGGTPAEVADDRDRVEALATWRDLLLPLSSALPRSPTTEFVDLAFAN